MSAREALLTAMSEVHSGNVIEANAILDAVFSHLLTDEVVERAAKASAVADGVAWRPESTLPTVRSLMGHYRELSRASLQAALGVEP